MNYLAHLYLSGPNEEVRVGNFIGDHVKGRRYQRYAPDVQKGILLHRQIDSFMDAHPLTRESASLFKPYYGRYAGVVIDIVYDHLLALNWSRHATQSLHRFVSAAHHTLLQHYFILPRPVKQFLPFLIKSRRMEHYRSLQGVERTLQIMAHYSSLPDHAGWAVVQIQDHYEILTQQFESFFEEVQHMSSSFLENEQAPSQKAI